MCTIWSRENSHKIVESNNRNDKKVTVFVAIVDGKAQYSAFFW